MLDNDNKKSNLAIISQIQSLVLAGLKPTDVLKQVSRITSNKDDFVDYMVKSFPENDGDVWVVASRWINSNISETAANYYLKPVFEQFTANYQTGSENK